MSVDSSKVRVAVTGAVSKAPTGSTAPTDASTALAAPFVDLGGISEDGVTLTLPDNGDKTNIKVWQGGASVRTVRSTSDDLPTIQFTLMETSLAAVETYFGTTVTQTATDGSFEYVVENRGADAYVLDVIDGAELMRVYIPHGVVASVGDVSLTHTDAIGYEVTIEAELDNTAGFCFKTWSTALKTGA